MSNRNYSSDSPVVNKADDRFSRWQFSERIAQVIARRSDPSSIVIGLHGIWGDGKTSVLNFIEQALEKNNDVICINFNPWRFGIEEELLTGFFYDIASALEQKLTNNGDKLKDFVKKAAPAAAMFGGKGLGTAVSSFISSVDIEELKTRIEKLLAESEKRVLVLIDDVDRLEKTEIHALFRLVKLTAGFKHISYILAFDKDIVASSLQERYASSSGNAGESFLEKIIQIPLHLPSVEKKVLREFCFSGVDEALRIADISLSDQQVQEFVRNFGDAFEDNLTTPRKAKLYGNILLFSLPILEGEVNPVDLMLIEGVRVFCPALYDTIRKNKEFFVGSFSESQYSDNSEEKKQIKSIIDTALKTEKNLNKTGYERLLKSMFPKLEYLLGNTSYGSDWHDQWNREQRICSPDYFSRYFSYSIPHGDISDKTVSCLIENAKAWLDPYLKENNPLNDYLVGQNTEVIIKKLRSQTETIPIDSSRSLSIALSQKSSEFQNPEAFHKWLNPFSQAAILISDLILNVPEAGRMQLACSCILEAPSIDFKLEIFRWVKKKDEEQPEKEGFSEEDNMKIGRKLSEDIIAQIKPDIDVTGITQAVLTVFYTLNKYYKEDYSAQYFKESATKDPSVLLRLLMGIVPTSWGMESGISHKSDFERSQYDLLVKYVDPLFIMNLIENHYSEAFGTLEKFPRRDEKDKLIYLKQFVWIHRYVLKETDDSEKKETAFPEEEPTK